MEHEPHPSPTAETGRSIVRIPPDFEPLYQLAEADYLRIINELSTLILASLDLLRSSGQAETARLIGDRAGGILADYDPDVAELVQSMISGDSSDPEFDAGQGQS